MTNKLKPQSTYATRTTGDHMHPTVARDVVILIQSAYLVTERVNEFGGPVALSTPEWYYLLTYELSNGQHGLQFYPESLLFSNDPDILTHEVIGVP
jgi:hypothetical protein